MWKQSPPPCKAITNTVPVESAGSRRSRTLLLVIHVTGSSEADCNRMIPTSGVCWTSWLVWYLDCWGELQSHRWMCFMNSRVQTSWSSLKLVKDCRLYQQHAPTYQCKEWRSSFCGEMIVSRAENRPHSGLDCGEVLSLLLLCQTGSLQKHFFRWCS